MHHPRRIARLIGLLGLYALLSSLVGCSSSHLEDPDVRLVRVDVVKARLLEQEFILTFHIENPNSISLPVRGLVYDIQLNDVQLASGESNNWFTVPAHGEETFTVPVQTNLWQHMKYIVKLLEKPNEPVRYRLNGEVKTGGMLGLFSRDVHVSRRGEIIPGAYLPE